MFIALSPERECSDLTSASKVFRTSCTSPSRRNASRISVCAALRRLHQYDFKTSFFDGQPPLSQKVGYPLIIGLSAFFTILTITLIQIDRRWGGTKYVDVWMQSCRPSLCLKSFDTVNSLRARMRPTHNQWILSFSKSSLAAGEMQLTHCCIYPCFKCWHLFQVQQRALYHGRKKRQNRWAKQAR